MERSRQVQFHYYPDIEKCVGVEVRLCETSFVSNSKWSHSDSFISFLIEAGSTKVFTSLGCLRQDRSSTKLAINSFFHMIIYKLTGVAASHLYSKRSAKVQKN